MIRKEMKLTDEQGQALDALLKATREDYAALVRRLLADEADKHNITFPHNMPALGANARKAANTRWSRAKGEREP